MVFLHIKRFSSICDQSKAVHAKVLCFADLNVTPASWLKKNETLLQGTHLTWWNRPRFRQAGSATL